MPCSVPIRPCVLLTVLLAVLPGAAAASPAPRDAHSSTATGALERAGPGAALRPGAAAFLLGERALRLGSRTRLRLHWSAGPGGDGRPRAGTGFDDAFGETAGAGPGARLEFEFRP